VTTKVPERIFSSSFDIGHLRYRRAGAWR
jgi:hypothetical protein